MSEEKRFVMYNGRKVIEGWPEQIAAAQQQTTYLIGGEEHPRVRYGDEADDWNADEEPCHDCLAVKGQYHVPGCDVEECPVCGGQAITCGCGEEEEEEEEEEE